MIEKMDAIITVNIVEGYIPINSGEVCFYFENICLIIIPHNTLIQRWAWYKKVDITIYKMVLALRVWLWDNSTV